MRSFSYPAVLTPEQEGGFMVQFPDLPEAITSGADRDDALAQAADCLDEAVAARIADGFEIPEPSPAASPAHLVAVPAAMAARAALYLALRETGISNAELAARLGCDEEQIRRMLDPRHETKSADIEAALAAVAA